MGNCTAKRPHQAYQSSVKVSVPNLLYLSRSTKSLLSVISHDINLIKLNHKAKVHKNSAISYLDSTSLIIAGGSDSSSSLTNRIFLINAIKKSILELPYLPVPIKHGHFCKSSKHLYCIGGVSETEDHDSSQLEEASPLMRYSYENKTWDVFKHINKKAADHFLHRKIIPDEDKVRESIFITGNPLLKDLMFPAVGFWDGKIYLIGGKIKYLTGFEVLDKIFVINVEDEEFRIFEEDYKMPVKVSGSSCFVRGGKGFVAGGMLEGLVPNMEIFEIDFDGKKVRKWEIGVDRPLEDHYPIIAEDKSLLCYSPPKLINVREDKLKCYEFTLPSINNINPQDFILEKIPTNPKPIAKVFVDLSLGLSKPESALTITTEAFIIPKTSASQHEEQIIIETKEIEITDFQNIINNIKNASFSFIDQDLEEKSQNELDAECDSGHVISRNSQGKGKVCEHCFRIIDLSWGCEYCEFYVCENCAKGLNGYKRYINSIIKCSHNHYYCRPYTEPSAQIAYICLNCQKTLSSEFLLCFICNEYLCLSCQSLLLEKISPSKPHLCPFFHELLPTRASELCGICQVFYKGIFNFYCQKCDFYICPGCVENPLSLEKLIPKFVGYQERPSKLSQNFIKIEKKIGDDPKSIRKRQPRKLPKSISIDISGNEKAQPPPLHVETEPFSPNNPQISDPGALHMNFNFENPLISKKPVTITNEELMKKIIKKPIRGSPSPFFFNLSPKRSDIVEQVTAQRIASVKYENFDSFKNIENEMKMNFIEIPQKTLHSSSNEPSIGDRNDLFKNEPDMVSYDHFVNMREKIRENSEKSWREEKCDGSNGMIKELSGKCKGNSEKIGGFEVESEEKPLRFSENSGKNNKNKEESMNIITRPKENPENPQKNMKKGKANSKSSSKNSNSSISDPESSKSEDTGIAPIIESKYAENKIQELMAKMHNLQKSDSSSSISSIKNYIIRKETIENKRYSMSRHNSDDQEHMPKVVKKNLTQKHKKNTESECSYDHIKNSKQDSSIIYNENAQELYENVGFIMMGQVENCYTDSSEESCDSLVIIKKQKSKDWGDGEEKDGKEGKEGEKDQLMEKKEGVVRGDEEGNWSCKEKKLTVSSCTSSSSEFYFEVDIK